MIGAGAWQVVMLVLVLGVVIVFHELGHFIAAKLVGVRVEVFSFGFGPRLFGVRRGPTDYRVSLIPLGGYVRMAGEGGEEGPTGAHDEYEQRRAWEKLLIMVMGPAFNLVLAVLLLAGGYMLGVKVPAWQREPPVVQHVVAKSPAAAAGMSAGDLVLSIDRQPTPDWQTLNDVVVLRPGQTVDVTVRREGAELTFPVTLDSRTKNDIGWLGAEPCLSVVVGSVSPGSPAAGAGVQVGDVVLAVDGQPPCSDAGIVELIQAAAGAPQVLRLDRDGVEQEVTVAAELAQSTGNYMIGVALSLQVRDLVTERYGLGKALAASVRSNLHDAGMVFDTVGRLVTGRLSLRTTSGPLELAGIAASTADQGLAPLLTLMALVSLNLGILNLLPIPVLDGGRIVLVLVEAVRGQLLARRTKEWILGVGVVMILTLMGLVLFVDLIKKIEG